MPSSHSTSRGLRLRRLFAWLALPALVLGLLLVHPQASWAASGGRIGGGSFRSAPSMPRSYGGGGGLRGGYGGGYGGGIGGGGIGFPFLIPIFGFGGGGLFGFLVLMAVVGLIANAVRGGGGPAMGGAAPGSLAPRADGPVSIAQLQVGLLASARQLQADLRRLAGTADTSTNAGLQTVLQETTLALLRHPDLWVYAGAEVGQVPFASAEATFNRLSMAERSKLDRELTTNVAGRRTQLDGASVGESDAASDFIAVTLLVASRRPISLRGADNAEQLRSSLQALGSVTSADLLALEVIWQPDGAGESFTTEQLLTAYPDLRHV
ncbi:DUF1517 domain-containing protein [Cyanobium sp. CH-040]|uniref:DUF1517 domain-containing protein n=1 Tax=Cyanobium sp. CH-040 TaxID=2823708 RepID=UPI0020CDE3FF|nr:DUF1517 domain-containing protein [Cyanobium sp. CH-040]MCP9928673.1 DUF1517 domain-containing protein [Cyanobium sp. CH-040]